METTRYSREEMVESVPQTGFFGHPRGLGILFFVEFWERFSYYGMRAILIYYMYDTVANGGLGMDKTTAASIGSMYGSLIFMTGILGGWIADRLLGSRKALLYGAILIMLGHIAMSLPFGVPTFLASMFLIIVGSGLMKPNISNVVGGLYHKNDSRMDGGFVIFYMSVNMGAFLSPLIVGALQKQYNYHIGFLAAALGMALALIVYVIFNRKSLGLVGNEPTNLLQGEEKKRYSRNIVIAAIALISIIVVTLMMGILTFNTFSFVVTILGIVLPIVYWFTMYRSEDVTTTERSRLLAYIPLFLASVMFWVIQEQGANTLALFAAERTQLNLKPLFGIDYTLPAAYFQSLNPLFIVILAPVISTLWIKLGKRNPTTPFKFTLGILFAGLSFLVMILPLTQNETHLINPLWLVLSFLLCVIGELCLSPTGSSVSVKLAPVAFNSQMLSLWFLSNATAQGLNAQFVKLIEPLGYTKYFIFIGSIAMILFVVILLMNRWISKKMDGIH
ncbi:peptide MFS transporter [Macrococcoides caseolyticum]|uniref:peptide MFS transporter n=1 Tax=Macrococcoides caseolyticum TaxID=69966 RepID=UPI001C5F3681|nr:peptide MFS transporter [Macrococcus caseolyticus]MDJ1108944.1 peptide MFS transporter [Macrococcus caseolyticus]QYA40547.1 peptide MFS transporter [Macrococcus caseolyticus]